MRGPIKENGGKGHVIEELDFFNGTAKHTGGDVYERRVNRNYSKVAHAQQDAAAKEAYGLPNVSTVKILPL